MKEGKIFLILVVLVGILYFGIEPYAHSKLHPHVSSANYDFSKEDNEANQEVVQKAKENLENISKNGEQTQIKNAKLALDQAVATQKKYSDFWADINKIDLKKGDVKKGAELVANAGCTGCHSIKNASMPAAMDDKSSSEAYGVVPPDLSNAGYIYDEKFLAALIKNPVMALKLEHKFNDEKPFPMPNFAGVEGDVNQEIANMVAYFKSIAPKKMSNEEVFKDACQRCHDMKYQNKFIPGNRQSLANYMGSTPPDLSMMIRSKGKEYLHQFINDTQKLLAGTSMPRVGLNQKAEDQVVEYIANTGDSKAKERSNTTIWIMIYFVILAVFAGLWKNKIWSKLH